MSPQIPAFIPPPPPEPEAVPTSTPAGHKEQPVQDVAQKSLSSPKAAAKSLEKPVKKQAPHEEESPLAEVSKKVGGVAAEQSNLSPRKADTTKGSSPMAALTKAEQQFLKENQGKILKPGQGRDEDSDVLFYQNPDPKGTNLVIKFNLVDTRDSLSAQSILQLANLSHTIPAMKFGHVSAVQSAQDKGLCYEILHDAQGKAYAVEADTLIPIDPAQIQPGSHFICDQNGTPLVLVRNYADIQVETLEVCHENQAESSVVLVGTGPYSTFQIDEQTKEDEYNKEEKWIKQVTVPIPNGFAQVTYEQISQDPPRFRLVKPENVAFDPSIDFEKEYRLVTKSFDDNESDVSDASDIGDEGQIEQEEEFQEEAFSEDLDVKEEEEELFPRTNFVANNHFDGNESGFSDGSDSDASDIEDEGQIGKQEREEDLFPNMDFGINVLRSPSIDLPFSDLMGPEESFQKLAPSHVVHSVKSYLVNVDEVFPMPKLHTIEQEKYQWVDEFRGTPFDIVSTPDGNHHYLAPKKAMLSIEEQGGKKCVFRNGSLYDLEEDGSIVGHDVPALFQEKVENLWVGQGREGLSICEPSQERTAFYDKINRASFLDSFIGYMLTRSHDGKIVTLKKDSNFLFQEQPDGQLSIKQIDLDSVMPPSNVPESDFVPHPIKCGLIGFPLADEPLQDQEVARLETMIAHLTSPKNRQAALDSIAEIGNSPEYAQAGPALIQERQTAYLEVIDKMASFITNRDKESPVTLKELFFHVFPTYAEHFNTLTSQGISREKAAIMVGSDPRHREFRAHTAEDNK